MNNKMQILMARAAHDWLMLPWGRPWLGAGTIGKRLQALPIRQWMPPASWEWMRWRIEDPSPASLLWRVARAWLTTGWLGRPDATGLRRLLERLHLNAGMRERNRALTQLYGFATIPPFSLMNGMIVDALEHDKASETEDRMDQAPSPDRNSLRAEAARWLVQNASHQSVAGFGLILLGHVGDKSMLGDVTPFLREEGFADLAMDAARLLVPDPLARWHALGKHLSYSQAAEAIGDIVAVASGNMPLRQWLIRTAPGEVPFFPDLALACARAARIDGLLAENPSRDTGLIDGAARILHGIFTTNDENNLFELAEGAELFLVVADRIGERLADSSKPPPIETLALAVAISGWLDRLEVAAARLARGRECGWTDAVRTEIRRRARRIMDHPLWPGRIMAILSDDTIEAEMRSLHWRLSSHVGLELWDDVMMALVRGHGGLHAWRDLLDTDDEARLGKVIRLAEENWRAGNSSARETIAPNLPLLLDGIKRTGFYAPGLVAASLLRPERRARLAALRVLTSRNWGEWGDEVRNSYASACAQETDEILQSAMARLAGSRYDGWLAERGGGDPRHRPGWLPTSESIGRRQR